MQRVFRGKLNAEDDILIKYKDEGKWINHRSTWKDLDWFLSITDGDMITIFDSADLGFAIQSESRVLRLKIYMQKGVEEDGRETQLEKLELPTLRAELIQMRDRVNKILDMLGETTTYQEPRTETKVSHTLWLPKSSIPTHAVLSFSLSHLI